MVNNKLKEISDEEELTQNYDDWRNHKITDAHYFRTISKIKTETY